MTSKGKSSSSSPSVAASETDIISRLRLAQGVDRRGALLEAGAPEHVLEVGHHAEVARVPHGHGGVGLHPVVRRVEEGLDVGDDLHGPDHRQGLDRGGLDPQVGVLELLGQQGDLARIAHPPEGADRLAEHALVLFLVEELDQGGLDVHLVVLAEGPGRAGADLGVPAIEGPQEAPHDLLALEVLEGAEDVADHVFVVLARQLHGQPAGDAVVLDVAGRVDGAGALPLLCRVEELREDLDRGGRVRLAQRDGDVAHHPVVLALLDHGSQQRQPPPIPELLQAVEGLDGVGPHPGVRVAQGLLERVDGQALGEAPEEVHQGGADLGLLGLVEDLLEGVEQLLLDADLGEGLEGHHDHVGVRIGKGPDEQRARPLRGRRAKAHEGRAAHGAEGVSGQVLQPVHDPGVVAAVRLEGLGAHGDHLRAGLLRALQEELDDPRVVDRVDRCHGLAGNLVVLEEAGQEGDRDGVADLPEGDHGGLGQVRVPARGELHEATRGRPQDGLTPASELVGSQGRFFAHGRVRGAPSGARLAGPQRSPGRRT
jgi:hypothetical protein